MKRFVVPVCAAMLMVAMIVYASPAGSSGHTILQFDTMAPVFAPYTGSTNPIRGVNGGGLPWQIGSANGKLSSDGAVFVRVSGLVLFEGDPVPPERQGVNPIASFRAIVSCLSSSEGTPTTVNVATDPFPASPDGDSIINATVSLPDPCFAPIVFVGPSATSWFAVTGR